MGIFENFANRYAKPAKLVEPYLRSETADEDAARADDLKVAARNAGTLQSVTSRVMVADDNYVIVDVNPAAIKMMRDAESDLRQVIPSFSVDRLLGSKIDIFHKNPAHQRAMLDSLTSTYTGQITVGARTFDLIANPIFDDNHKRLGTVVEWQDVTARLKQEALEKEKIELERKQAADNSRIKSALDCVSSNVMMADQDNVIVYANDAVLTMLRKAETDIRKQLPNFNAGNLIGNSVDIFHKNPAHQKQMLTALNSTYRTEIMVGGRTFALIANPVFDKEGKRIGTVVEWNDRTEELEFEKIVENTINSAVSGDLASRIDASSQQGFLAKISNGINQLMDIFERVLGDAADSIGALSAGDLTRKIETEYEGTYDRLKADINSTIDKLEEVVTEIRESAANVKVGAQEIASGNTNLSQRTEEQAASLEETSSAMEEITTTVQQNAANAMQANTLARSARETAENGGNVVGRAVAAMQAISESSNKINDIIGVIDEIAFQTNLLALNAAVEAARAGDQGRGFAVVADEVRSLAGRSATAAKEIKELIKDSGEKVQEGSSLVNKSGETLEEIVNAVKKVNDIVAEISTASEEQATGLDEINRAVGEMDEMTQQNAALVEEAAAASESLGNQAESLDQLISFFNLGRETQRAAAPARTRKEAAPVKSTAGKPKSKLAAGKTTRAAAPATPKSDDEDKNWSEF